MQCGSGDPRGRAGPAHRGSIAKPDRHRRAHKAHRRELAGYAVARLPQQLLHHATRANVRMSANYLRHGSGVLEQLIQHGGLTVAGAQCSLETGVVGFFDGVPK